MKFDIARAWKDETYRQSLSTEQLNSLPANPAGELTDADLATITGAGGFDGPAGVGGVGGVGALGVLAIPTGSQRNESVALICEVNVFSINVNVINLLASLTQVCIKG